MTPLDVTPRSAEPEAQPPKSEMATRVASAVVLAVLALGAVVASPWSFAALVIAAGVAVAWEWGRLVRGRSFDGTAAIQAAAVAAIAVSVTLARPDLALVAVAAALAGTAIFGLSSDTLGWSLAGLAYLVLPAWAMVWLRSDPTFGAASLLYLFAVAWTTDTTSYVGGRLIGGPPLSLDVATSRLPPLARTFREARTLADAATQEAAISLPVAAIDAKGWQSLRHGKIGLGRKFCALEI